MGRQGDFQQMIPNLSYFDYYLIGINIAGFLFYIINMLLYRYTANGRIDVVLTIVSLALGAPGILLAILLFDRKPIKENMMSRVFVICVFVIEIIGLLYFKGGYHNDRINLAFWDFFGEHKILLTYLILINVVTLIAFGIDKINAAEHRNRIRIVTLLGLSFIGGSIGALIAMYSFRHKTQKDYFSVGVPLIIVMQIIVIFFIMNNTSFGDGG